MKNPFKRTIKLPEMQTSMEVLIVEETGTMFEILGISEERVTELKDAMVTAMDRNGITPFDAIAEASKACKHPNELAMVVFVIGQWDQYQSHPLVKLMIR